MQSLLRWGIENSTPQNNTTTTTTDTNTNNNNNAPPARRTDLHPEIIDLLLGKSDAQLMKEAMAIATDESNTEEDRVSALDNLEMLIEQIDNANDLENLKMWDPLHALLTSSTDGITTQTLWVIGTALQNNPSAQDAYLKLNPLPTLTSFLSLSPTTTTSPSPSPSKHLRSKAIYALSGLLKHNAPALLQLGVTDADGCDGWDKIRMALQDPDISIRRKTLFLLNALLISSPSPSPSTFSSSSPSPGNLSQNLHTPSQNQNSQNSQNAQNPIHPNSHSMHLSDPSRASTAPPTYEALRTHGIIDTLIDGLTRFMPHGEDGDNREEADREFEEMGVTLLNTYLSLTHSQSQSPSPSQTHTHTKSQHPPPPLTASQKTRLRDWISSLTKDAFSNESDETSGNGLGNGTSENGLGNGTSGNGGDEETSENGLGNGTSGNGGNKKLAERWGMSVKEVEDFVGLVVG